MTLLIAHLSDSHTLAADELLYGTVDTNAALERAVEAINRLDPQPDLVIHTGDVANNGGEAEYVAARRALERLKAPLAIIPGNHDDRYGLRRAFDGLVKFPETGFLHQVVQLPGLDVILMDSVVPGQIGGHLCEKRLAFLEEAMADAGRREVLTLLAIHHPPGPIGIATMDRFGLDNGEAVRSIISFQPPPVRILTGHVHRAAAIDFAPSVMVTAPSTSHQLTLELDPERVAGWNQEPAGFFLHWMDLESPDGAVVASHLAVVQPHEQHPFPGAPSRLAPLERGHSEPPEPIFDIDG